MEQTFDCPTCNISCSDLKYLLEHFQTLEHAHRIQKKANKEEVKNNISQEQYLSNRRNETLVCKDYLIADCEKSLSLECIPSETINKSENVFYSSCAICQKNFNGPEPYKQHMVSAAHLKKVALSDFTANTNSSSNSNIGVLKTCNICNKNFTGIIPYEEHLNSQIHRKNVYSESLLKQPKETSSTKCDSVTSTSFGALSKSNNIANDEADVATNDLNKPIVSGSYASIVNVLNASLYSNWFCTICKKQCTGPVPYREHKSSEVHRKNLRRVEDLQKIFEIKNETYENYYVDLPQVLPNKINNHNSKKEDPKFAIFRSWYCNICQKQCSGPIPFQQHMSSNVHRKNLMREEIKSGLCQTQISEIKQSETSVATSVSNQSENVTLQKLNPVSQRAHPQKGVFENSESKMENFMCTPQMQSAYLFDEHASRKMAMLLPEEWNMTFFAVDAKIDFDNLPKNNYEDALRNASLPNYVRKLLHTSNMENMDFE
ncbi:uncharacterized protein LOC118184646 [Stegodyphus dumicola]|uniref:uncharacterized protein LOC118184646 n=1 Tax=Stegodyphus dumicola TaxID=202533 RepID=UPI0015A787DB|nr:uncharacterized protein LOC118184646 [Stegodyphus dumicola]